MVVMRTAVKVLQLSSVICWESCTFKLVDVKSRCHMKDI